MANKIIIKSKIKKFNKTIKVSGDKSISIRWVLFASLANGISRAKNLLMSEDVIAAIRAIKKFGIKSKITKDECKIFGKGVDGYNYKKNITIDARNSGTLGRLILGFLVNSPYPIKIIGDKSLSKRDFKRIADPLRKFGAKFKLKKNKNLPLVITGSSNLKPITYNEHRICTMLAVIFAGMRTEGNTVIKARKSRNHAEVMSKNLKLPIKIKSEKL